MAQNSKTSPSLSEQMEALMQKAREENRVSEILNVIHSSAGSSGTTMSSAPMPGSMTDASKRARDDTWESTWDMVPTMQEPPQSQPSPSVGPVRMLVQHPVTPAAQHDGYSTLPATVLPLGITSVEEWGATLCELPKVVKLRASYQELVTKSETDPELRTYFLRYILKHSGPSPKVADFRKYVECIRYGQNSKTYLPGSSTVERKMK